MSEKYSMNMDGGRKRKVSSQQQQPSMKKIATSIRKEQRLVHKDIPISLGKPSLRKRLEAYYKVIAPKQIINEEKWRNRFDLIYQKYGGTIQGEATLSNNLVKKYGTNIRLLLTTNQPSQEQQGNDKKREESWFTLRPEECDSHIVDFTSNHFDPFATLMTTSQTEVERINQINNKQTPIFDFCDKFRPLLPHFDPYHFNHSFHSSQQQQQLIKTKKKNKSTNPKIPVFSALASTYENAGPLSLLYSIHSNNKRIRVMVRYVDCVRGILTGYLIAFDKHFNMILRDVDETYNQRVTQIFNTGENTYTKAELERLRRTNSTFNPPTTKTKQNNNNNKIHDKDTPVKMMQRHFPQMLVRGDTVIMVWRADQEKKQPTNNNTLSSSCIHISEKRKMI